MWLTWIKISADLAYISVVIFHLLISLAMFFTNIGTFSNSSGVIEEAVIRPFLSTSLPVLPFAAIAINFPFENYSGVKIFRTVSGIKSAAVKIHSADVIEL